MSYWREFREIHENPLIDWKEDGTVFVETEGDPHHFQELDEVMQKLILEWMKWNIEPSERVYHGSTSYGMKHKVEYRTSIYMSNNQFKEAMLMLGFVPEKISELNWEFYVKPSSPIFKLFKDNRYGYPVMGLEILKERIYQ